MTENSQTIKAQDDFKECYRGRLGALYHLSYLRLCKSKLLFHLLKKMGVSLDQARVFDYAFGAGTFLGKLPRSASLYGVEIDPVTVDATRQRLASKGFSSLVLDVIDIETWKDHPLLTRQYDVVVLSHILEHLEDPAYFLNALRPCLEPGGVIVGLVPINETVADPHHVQECNRVTIADWAAQSGLSVKLYLETDHWNYWAKKYLPYTTRPRLRKVWSLACGVASSCVPDTAWWSLSNAIGPFLGAKPTQAGFIFKVADNE